MTCWFKHNWIYSEKRKAYFDSESYCKIYDKRTCSKCEVVQENVGFFDISFGMENYWKDRWRRIK